MDAMPRIRPMCYRRRAGRSRLFRRDESGGRVCFGWGTADNCIQPVGVEVHLREDISWAPDREVSNHYGSPGQFLDVGSFCQWTPGSWHAYFVETRINVNGSVKQKQQSNRWVIDY